MVVGILQVELAIPGVASLHEKRSVVRSVKDRLRRHHAVSVAEVGRLEHVHSTILGIAVAASAVPQCDSVLDKILKDLARERDCFLADVDRQVLTGQPAHHDSPTLADTAVDNEDDDDDNDETR